jgi:Uma2 family endonuclease
MLRAAPDALDHYLALVGDRPNALLVKFDGENLTLVRRGQTHGRTSTRLNLLIMAYMAVTSTSYRAYGSTLFRDPRKPPGLEPDHSFYIQNFERVRRKQIDLTTDPPPDLIVEIVVSHDPKTSLNVCRALSVPEVWHLFPAEGRTAILHRVRRGQRRGDYREQPRSHALPLLTSKLISRWVLDDEEDDDTAYNAALRERCRRLLQGELPLKDDPRWPPEPITPTRSPCSKAWSTSAAGPGCTSGGWTRRGCTTSSGRSWTTRSTRS